MVYQLDYFQSIEIIEKLSKEQQNSLNSVL